jgi:hypothetical protein
MKGWVKFEEERTFPDSPAPRSNILISFLANMRSLLSWLSISSLPVNHQGRVSSIGEQVRGRHTSFGFTVDLRGLNAAHLRRSGGRRRKRRVVEMARWV